MRMRKLFLIISRRECDAKRFCSHFAMRCEIKRIFAKCEFSQNAKFFWANFHEILRKFCEFCEIFRILRNFAKFCEILRILRISRNLASFRECEFSQNSHFAKCEFLNSKFLRKFCEFPRIYLF